MINYALANPVPSNTIMNDSNLLKDCVRNLNLETLDVVVFKNRVLNTDKVIVVQIQISHKAANSEFENVACMYSGVFVEFAIINVFRPDYNTMKFFEKIGWNINGSNGKVSVFENKQFFNSTQNIETNEVVDIVYSALLINKKRRNKK